jgi:hypothetical protein
VVHLGLFARAGWTDGNVEPWDFTDIDRTVSGGFSLSGKQWGRSNDTVGVAARVNGHFQPVHQALLELRRLWESWSAYGFSAVMRLTFDYPSIIDGQLPNHQPCLQHRAWSGLGIWDACALAVHALDHS